MRDSLPTWMLICALVLWFIYSFVGLFFSDIVVYVLCMWRLLCTLGLSLSVYFLGVFLAIFFRLFEVLQSFPNSIVLQGPWRCWGNFGLRVLVIFSFLFLFFIMARICMILCNCSRTLVLISYSYFTCLCECVYELIYNHFLPSDIHIYLHRHIYLSTSFCSFIYLSVYLITFLHLYICACMDLHAHSIPIICELAPKTSLPRWSNLALSFFSTLSFFQYITKGS